MAAVAPGAPAPRRAAPRLPRRSLMQGVWLFCAGCAENAIESPPPGPRPSRPAELIPPDLQLIVRVALKRLEQSLGKLALEKVRRDSGLSTSLSDPLIGWALERAETAWAAVRLGLSPEQTDNVLVLTGDFSELRPEPRLWASPSDLGAGWQYWQRRTKVRRAEPTRVYAFAGELLLFVSEAEIDPVERLLELGARTELVEAPEDGMLSFAASMPALANVVRPEAPRAADILMKGKSVTGFADLQHGTGASVDLSFEFADEEQATRSATAARALVEALQAGGGSVAELSRSLSVEPLGKSVALRLRVPDELMSRLLCSEGGACQ